MRRVDNAQAPARLCITTGRFADAAPYTSDYGYEQIYYRSIGARREDWLTTRDFVWRWDSDWFKSLHADSYFPKAEFWRCYGGEAYAAMKRRYDPRGRFPDLYAKCVLRA